MAQTQDVGTRTGVVPGDCTYQDPHHAIRAANGGYRRSVTGATSPAVSKLTKSQDVLTRADSGEKTSANLIDMAAQSAYSCASLPGLYHFPLLACIRV